MKLNISIDLAPEELDELLDSPSIRELALKLATSIVSEDLDYEIGGGFSPEQFTEGELEMLRSEVAEYAEPETDNAQPSPERSPIGSVETADAVSSPPQAG